MFFHFARTYSSLNERIVLKWIVSHFQRIIYCSLRFQKLNVWMNIRIIWEIIVLQYANYMFTEFYLSLNWSVYFALRVRHAQRRRRNTTQNCSHRSTKSRNCLRRSFHIIQTSETSVIHSNNLNVTLLVTINRTENQALQKVKNINCLTY